MNKKYTYLFCALCLSPQLFGQGSVSIEFEQDGLALPIEDVDRMQSDPQSQRVEVSFPVSRQLSTSEAVAADKVDLANEKAQSFNVLQSVSFSKADNKGMKDDVTVNLGNETSATLVFPYLSSVSSLVPDFSGTGSHVFVNGKLWHKGDKVDFSSPVPVKMVAFNGDVRTYHLTVTKSDLPYVDLTSNKSAIGKDWTEGTISIDASAIDGMSVKGKGSHFADGLKNNFALKFNDKKSLLGITKNKRWLLVANEADNSLMRAQIGYWLAKQIAEDGDWTPTSKSVNLSVDGQFVGCYSLVEQPRICKGRYENGYLLTVEQEADLSDDAFRTSRSNTLLVFDDPETGAKGTVLIRIQDVINKFEKALYAENWTEVEDMADMKSLANWLVVNEIAANGEAFTADTYVYINTNGKIAMMPAWNLKKAFGCESNDCEMFVATQTPWMQQLLKNKNFESLVKQQYAKIKKQEKELDAFISKQSQELNAAAVANNAVWNNLNSEAYGNMASQAYDKEIERLKKWLSARFQWLDSQW